MTADIDSRSSSSSVGPSPDYDAIGRHGNAKASIITLEKEYMHALGLFEKFMLNLQFVNQVDRDTAEKRSHFERLQESSQAVINSLKDETQSIRQVMSKIVAHIALHVQYIPIAVQLQDFFIQKTKLRLYQAQYLPIERRLNYDPHHLNGGEYYTLFGLIIMPVQHYQRYHGVLTMWRDAVSEFGSIIDEQVEAISQALDTVARHLAETLSTVQSLLETDEIVSRCREHGIPGAAERGRKLIMRAKMLKIRKLTNAQTDVFVFNNVIIYKKRSVIVCAMKTIPMSDVILPVTVEQFRVSIVFKHNRGIKTIRFDADSTALADDLASCVTREVHSLQDKRRDQMTAVFG